MLISPSSRVDWIAYASLLGFASGSIMKSVTQFQSVFGQCHTLRPYLKAGCFVPFWCIWSDWTWWSYILSRLKPIIRYLTWLQIVVKWMHTCVIKLVKLWLIIRSLYLVPNKDIVYICKNVMLLFASYFFMLLVSMLAKLLIHKN